MPGMSTLVLLLLCVADAVAICRRAGDVVLDIDVGAIEREFPPIKIDDGDGRKLRDAEIFASYGKADIYLQLYTPSVLLEFDYDDNDHRDQYTGRPASFEAFREGVRDNLGFEHFHDTETSIAILKRTKEGRQAGEQKSETQDDDGRGGTLINMWVHGHRRLYAMNMQFPSAELPRMRELAVEFANANRERKTCSKDEL